ncbi:MAG: hypothetical protein OIF48_12735 [Silicimonas sp.]|nr:hypothetical protein [Silicimonas sp.]
MLDIPFPLETVPAKHADAALDDMIAECDGVTPVYLGDRDVFSTEWAEYVDVFENPRAILAEARALDAESWFANRIARKHPREVELSAPRVISRVLQLVAAPFEKLGRGESSEADGAPDEAFSLAEELRAQLAQLDRAGTATAAELDEMRAVIREVEAGALDGLFPDPVDYITPRRGQDLAAAMIATKEPWESAAWLQHGAYAACAPNAVFVAHCRWMWQNHGARIITASTNHVGFQMAAPINTAAQALDMLRRFELLGAAAINGDEITGDGASLIGAKRLWVGWD